MKLALAFGALLVTGSVAAAKPAPSWRSLVSRDGLFAIRMPTAIQESDAPSREEGVTVWQYLYQAHAPSGNDYVASCWDYTNAPRRRLEPGELDECVRVQRESLRPGSFSVKRVSLGSVPGRELRIRRSDGSADLFRFYVHGRRLYSVSVCANGPTGSPEQSDAFLDSFRLLP